MSPPDPEWTGPVEEAPEFLTLVDEQDRIVYLSKMPSGGGDFVGQSIFDFVLPEYHGVARGALAAARETGLPQRYESHAADQSGDVSHFSNWVCTLRTDRYEGRITAFIATNITELRRTEVALERSEGTLRSLVDNAPDVITIVDPDQRIVFINRVPDGVTREELLGRLVGDFMPDAEREKVTDAIDSVFATGEHTAYETFIDFPSRLYYHTRLSPIVLEGEVQRVALVSRNVTERRRAEEEQARLAFELQQVQKMEALGQLTGGVAHDFNNLLTLINGNLELLRVTGGLDERASLFVSEAVEAAGRAADLTSRLLAFSRKQELSPRVIDVNELVEGLSTLLRRTLGESIRLTTSPDEDLWPCEVDPGRLEQALLNLVVNARDAMPGGGELEIVTGNVALEPPGDAPGTRLAGPHVRLSVRDTGVGMSPDVVRLAVEPFFSTKEAGRGTGLGLSMVYGFVSQSGGHMELESDEGEGTTVHLYLPRSVGVAEGGAEELASRGGEREGGGEVVLVVEDDPEVRLLSTRLIERLGYRTITAGDAADALERLRECPDVALLFSDVGLPGGVNGFELARRARVAHEGLPVLFASGYPEDQTDALGMREEAELLRKPFRLAELRRAIRDAIDG